MKKASKLEEYRILVENLINENQSNTIVDLKRLHDEELDKQYEVFYVETSEDKYILKNSREGYEPKIYETFFNTKEFAVPGYINKLTYTDNKVWFLLEYIEGQVFKEESLDSYCLAAEELAKIHARYLDIDFHDDVYSFVKNNTVKLLDTVEKLTVENKLLKWNTEIINMLEYTAKRFVNRPQTLIQGDLLPINIMKEKNSDIKLIDWEHAAIGCYSQDIGRLLGDFRDDKGKPWVNSDWEMKILTSYYKALCDRTPIEITWDEFLLDYNCSRLWNYAGIVLAHVFNKWHLTSWYHLNYDNLLKSIEIITDMI